MPGGLSTEPALTLRSEPEGYAAEGPPNTVKEARPRLRQRSGRADPGQLLPQEGQEEGAKQLAASAAGDVGSGAGARAGWVMAPLWVCGDLHQGCADG